MKGKLTLGKEERLKSRKAIEELFEKGSSFNVSPIRVIYSNVGPRGLRFGVGVSTRSFKKAVDRNKIKRRIREAYRLQKPPLQQALKEHQKGMNIFLVFTGKEISDYAVLSAAVKKSLLKLQNLVSENNTSHT